MRKIANKIVIENELKTDYKIYYDEEGNEIHRKEYQYKEYKVLDSEDYILEIGQWTGESITVEEILQMTGIRFGISAYII